MNAMAAPVRVTFKDRALLGIKYGFPVIWVNPGEKVTSLSGWPDLATTDLAQIEIWNAEDENRNVGYVAKAYLDGFWFLDIDKPGTLQRCEAETGKKVILKWGSRSQEGKGHCAFRQTPASIAMGNIEEKSVKDRAFSCRVHNKYIIGPLSYRQDLDRTYELIFDAAPVEAPDWLIEWCISQKVSAASKPVETDKILFPPGARHDALVSQAGKLKNQGFSDEAIETALISWFYDNCEQSNCAEPPEKHIHNIVASQAWQRGNPASEVIYLSGRLAGAPEKSSVSFVPEIDTRQIAERPSFPSWVLEGTTIGEGLVKPALEYSQKHAEFLFLPAVQVVLNYLSGKVSIKQQDVKLNMYLGLVSPYGQFFKSSSCELVHKYFEHVGLLQYYKSSLRNSEGRIIVASAGSSEGLGKAMQTIVGKHAILYYEELGKFVSKAGIENSSLAHDLLTFYDAGPTGNLIKSGKDSFALDAGTYMFSWLWCTTDRGFNRHWPKIAGISSGLEDRMFFVVSPKDAKPPQPFRDPPLLYQAAAKTKDAIDAALAIGEFTYEDIQAAGKQLTSFDPRSLQYIQKLALYFSVDLRESQITPDCLERAIALVNYRNQGGAFLSPIEADNQIGRLQKEITREIQRSGGKMKYRDLCLKLDYKRYGLDWGRAMSGLMDKRWGGDVAEYEDVVQTSRGSRKVHMVYLVKYEEDEL